jgi:ketosteroid isomerase-like protein
MPEAGPCPQALATVRAHLERIEAGDIVQATMDYAEDAVLEAGLRGVVALEGTVHGRAAIGEWLENWFSSFQPGSYRFQIDEAIEAGDWVYLALGNTALGQASGIETTLHTHNVFAVRAGSIVRHAFSGEREEMLRAAGIVSG